MRVRTWFTVYVIFFFTTLLCVPGPAWSDDEPAPRLEARQVILYRKIADRICDRIGALQNQYPHFATVNSQVHGEDSRDKLWLGYHYQHGMSWVPNPNYRPGAKGDKSVKSFSAVDGIEIDLYFYEGSWQGQAAVLPFDIGKMHVVSFIEGSDTPDMRSIKRTIGRILDDEKAAFQKQQDY